MAAFEHDLECEANRLRPRTSPITGRRRLIFHCQLARLRRSGASDCSLLDLGYRMTRRLCFLKFRTQVGPKIVTMFCKDLFAYVV